MRNYKLAREFREKLFEEKPIRECHWCGAGITFLSSTADHVTPLSDRGLDSHDNLVLSCDYCNRMRNYISMFVLYGKLPKDMDIIISMEEWVDLYGSMDKWLVGKKLHSVKRMFQEKFAAESKRRSKRSRKPSRIPSGLLRRRDRYNERPKREPLDLMNYGCVLCQNKLIELEGD